MTDVVTYDVVPRAGVIDLGKQVEGLVTRVVLPNIRRGEGAVQLVHQRADDQKPYLVPITEDGDKVYWIVSRLDTAYPGRGQAELQWLGANGEVAKSVTYQTNTTRSMAEPGAVPDEPLKPYTQAVAKDAQAAKNAAASASEAARSAEASAGQAWLSADNAAKSLKKLEDGIASGDFRGEKGDKGDKGDTGEKGEKGDRGEVGPAGDTTAAAAAAEAAKKAAQEAQKAAETAVLYTEQNLTDSQQEQARTNINAADKARQNVLVGTETGNPITVDDAFAAPLCGLTVYGKSTQDGTPSPDNPVPIVSAGDGGSVAVKVTGKNLLDFLHAKITKTGWPSGGFTRDDSTLTVSSVNGWNAYWFESPVPGKQISVSLTYQQIDDETASTSGAFTIGTSDAIQYPSGTDYMFEARNPGKTWATARGSKISKRYIFLFLRVAKEGANEKRTIEIKDFQLELGSIATAYSPYREQLLTLPTPNGLSGIPVTSGGNYTDQSGQQWICDEVDLERGVRVQRVDKAAFDNTKTLAEQNAILATPIETPLPPAEIAAYKALTAYAPDTVVQASDGAGAKLDYQRDVNIAIKKLEDAIASMTAN